MYIASALNAVKVIVSEDEPIESILRRFKRGVNQSGHLFELRFKEHWENAHDMRKRKVCIDFYTLHHIILYSSYTIHI